ncbi:MAG: methylmalonyl Co-A mutase-associated GTPase MeaB [Paludibacteraceae bacterium]|nr:methylmalonyl Co-A mutase-associated GTPase MeaB [Paludibacteraceae bacterium]
MKKTHHIENAEQFIGLSVNEGVAKPPSINPYLKKRIRRSRYTTEQYVNGILSGDISILSQAVTLVESVNPAHHEQAQAVIEHCLPHAGKSVRVGITGVPGAGKSTFIEALGMQLINNNHRLAVLAIDPSSERSKGSILGDKTRMEDLAVAKNAFIRPSPSTGSLGGVARKTRESIVLCEAAGFDTIFVETVGVGQSETAVHSMVDFFLLIQLAGTGDELQGIKRGIMEMADGITINKADGNNIEKSELAARQFQNALHLFPKPESDWEPKVLTCSAFHKIGIEEVWKMISDYVEFTKSNGFFDKKRHHQSKYWMYETINESLHTHFFNNPTIEQMLEEYEWKLSNNKVSSFVAAHHLLDEYFNHQK